MIMNTTSKLRRLGLTLSLMVALAASLGGCGPAAAPDGEPEVASSPLQSPLTGWTPAARSEAVKGPPVATAATPTAQTASTTAKLPAVGATIDYSSQILPSSKPSSIPGTDRSPSTVSGPHDTRSSRTEGNNRPPTGYLLTGGQGNGVPPGSNSESSEGYSWGYSGDIAGASGSASVSGQADPVQGQPYTWQDGDRTLTVLLQPDLEVEDGDITVREESEDATITRSSKGDIGKKGVSSDGSDVQPVFRSESGELMTLPGGVLLTLDPGWSQAETDAFFVGNGIELNRVSDLGFVDNGFFVETEPGFPSLNLANSLAGQDGVVLSSPNWWTEISPE